MSKEELIEAILDIIHSADSGLSTHQRVSEIEKVLNQSKEEKEGIETHRWGYYMNADDKKLIATCIAKTLYEAEAYFEDEGLSYGGYVDITILNQNKDDNESKT